MRVLHLSSLYPPIVHGGAELSVAILAEEQARRGYDVGVATLAHTPESPRKQNGVLVHRMGHANLFWPQDWPKHAAPIRYLNKLLEIWNPVMLRNVRAVIDSFHPDVLHSHSMVGVTVSAWKAAAERNIPIVHTLRDFNLFCRNSNAFRNGRMCQRICLACRINEPKRWLSRLVSAVVGVSSDTLRRHLELGLFDHIPEERRLVICNAVRPKLSHFPKPLSWPFTFGFIGRVVLEKGILTLLDAIANLPPQGWRLLIAGEIEASMDAEALRARTAGLPVDWLGFVDASDFFSQIDILVVPSIWAEPFGRVVIEAFANGVPVIGSRIGGITEQIEQGVTGWYFEAGNAALLGALFAECLRAGREALPNPTAFTRMLSKTSPEFVAGLYEDVYRRVIEDPLFS